MSNHHVCAACGVEITDPATLVTSYQTVRREARGGMVARKVARYTHTICPETAAAIEALRAMPAGPGRDAALRALGA